MRSLALVALSALAACSFLLDETPPPQTIDAAIPDDAAVDAAPLCDVTLAPATLEDDTMIADGSAENQNYNDFQNMTISDQLASVGLLRFSLPSLPNNARVVELILTLPHAVESNQCDTSCGSCDGIARNGELEVFIGRNDWVAETVTWVSRGDDPWQLEGAKGIGEDRVEALGSAAYFAGADLVFTADVSDSEFSFAGELTLILDGTQDGPDDDTWTKLVVSTKENDCSKDKVFAELTLGYCLDKN